MMAHNLCYTTLLDRTTIERLRLEEGTDYVKTPNNGKSLYRLHCYVQTFTDEYAFPIDFFATRKLREGLLPIVLQDLLAARKRAKNDLKVEKDPFKRAVLDGRQLALKVRYWGSIGLSIY